MVIVILFILPFVEFRWWTFWTPTTVLVFQDRTGMKQTIRAELKLGSSLVVLFDPFFGVKECSQDVSSLEWTTREKKEYNEVYIIIIIISLGYINLLHFPVSRILVYRWTSILRVGLPERYPYPM